MPISLPIDAIKTTFLNALHANNTLVLSAAPGAGKSTRLPLWLLAFEPLLQKKIYLLQPRRIAAKNIACYLAQQLGENVGQTVGYRLRNDTKVSIDTRLEVITEGILTQIIQNDPELSDCGLIVLDEFHERSLHGDLAFALACDVQQGLREDLKILLMSATLSTKLLLEQLPNAFAMESEGRCFPVDIEYLPPVSSKISTNKNINYSTKIWREHALKISHQYGNEHKGSILVFLPGVADIRYLADNLRERLPGNMILSPLYGELSIVEQQQAIAPAAQGFNKLVLATNIAETSLTIEGVNLVIDCGLEKVALYDGQTMTNRLHQQAISKASATQRAGRAGRLMPGRCLRLYSQEAFERRSENSISEIQQTDLLPLLIESARWGVSKLSDLPLLELPVASKEQMAWQELQGLNIVDGNKRLTKHGGQVANLGCHPRFAHMIITAIHLEKQQNIAQLAFLACLITAFLEERDIYRGEQARFDCDIQHRLVDILQKNSRYQSAEKRIFEQAHQLARTLKLRTSIKLPLDHSGTLLALAFPERVAKYRGRAGDYRTTQGKGISIELEDAMLGEEYLVAAQISQSQGNYHNSRDTLCVRLAAAVDLNILLAWQLVEVTDKLHLAYDNKQDRIVAKKQRVLGALVIEEQSVSEQLTEQQISAMWSEQVINQGLNIIPWSDNAEALLARWRWLNQYQTQLALPEVDDAALIMSLSTWFTPFVGKIKSKVQLRKCDFLAMLMSLLNYQQQQLLSKMAPTHFVGPTGRQCPIRYSQEKSPIVSLPMQELYGVQITPTVGDVANNTAIPLILEILSPAKRPIQITQDLVAFWQGSYKAVQKDMKAQYPRHFWPDDPINAKATNKTKRHLL